MSVALTWAVTAFTVTAVIAFVGLRAWRGWLDLRRYEIAATQSLPRDETDSGTRIEMAGIKERLRKLEAIATGVDL